MWEKRIIVCLRAIMSHGKMQNVGMLTSDRISDVEHDRLGVMR
jgi:hypothetical protein